MRKLSLRPYHGAVWVCESLDELRAAYEKQMREPYPFADDPNGGRFVRLDRGCITRRIWLVWAATPHALAHEFAHVLLHTFGTIGHNPTEGDGEPFCYMLSQLMLEAA
jgi:hypothetical protein